MKKIILWLVICLSFIAVFSASLIILLQRNKTEQKITLCNWYDYKESEVMAVSTKEVTYSTPYHFSASFTPISNDFFSHLKADKMLVKATTCLIDHYSIEGYLLFSNNNYYFLYEINKVSLINLICTIEYNNLSLVIPFQSFLTLDVANIPSSKDAIKNYFDTTTFDESRLFYSKFNTQFIEINQNKEQIKISSLDISSKQRYEICLDFNNKSITALIGDELHTIYN